jgi:hypothetical protein
MFEKEHPFAPAVLTVLLLGSTDFGVWCVNQDTPFRTASRATPCEATKRADKNICFESGPPEGSKVPP